MAGAARSGAGREAMRYTGSEKAGAGMEKIGDGAALLVG